VSGALVYNAGMLWMAQCVAVLWVAVNTVMWSRLDACLLTQTLNLKTDIWSSFKSLAQTV